MAQCENNSTLFQPEGQTNYTNPQLQQIEKMLGARDENGKIAQQVNQCMIDDGITLELLSQFDEKSSAETIDTWKLDTFDQKLSIIRGLLISGIKKNNPKAVLSETELKMMNKLSEYEKTIIDKITLFENESKINQDIKDKSYKTYHSEIESTFSNIISILIQRKEILLNRLEKLFSKRENEERNHISGLESVSQEIAKLKQEFENNTSKYNKISDISIRGPINCQMIKDFLDKYRNIKHYLPPCDYIYRVTFDKESIDNIITSTHLLGTVCPNTAPPEVVISNETKELRANINHVFDVLRIKDKGRLTVQGWDKLRPAGGRLVLRCNKLILENGSCINVDGKGYQGGDDKHPQGYSIGYNSLLYGKASKKLLNQANNGGGGMGFAYFGYDGWGGGGGYGCDGTSGQGKNDKDGKNSKNSKNGNDGDVTYGKGGNSYGKAELFELNGLNVHLGSGGGAGSDITKWYNGGNGGGAIIIECDDAIVIKKGCVISANGSKKNSHGGCGSGGSIYLKAPIIVNQGHVTAMSSRRLHGSGGFGRIRVDCNENIAKELKSGTNFEPNIEYNGLLT